MKNRTRFVGLVAAMALGGSIAAPAAAQAPEEFPRDETLYTGGKQWGPISTWNPIDTNYAMGTLGFVYEPLFNYDPMTNEYIPWLATEESGWTGDMEYTIKVREGVSWADGEPLTSADVKFTIDLGQYPAIPYSNIWDFIESTDAPDDQTVVVTFTAPQHHQWANFLYNFAMVPEHLWKDLPTEPPEDPSDLWIYGPNLDAENGWFPIGTGPYEYLAHDITRQVWQKRDGDWWATEVYGLDPTPKYIIDLVNTTNNTALGTVLQGQQDLNNNFLPGIASLIQGYGLKTYYDEPPYMLSANTAWVNINTTKPPLDDPEFRKAIANAVNVDDIVKIVYGNIVLPASPTGLLPVWEQWVDQAVVDELGFSYDPDKARQLLADAGYVDSDGDGFVENLDGSPIELKVAVPSGWTDWMESARVISEGAQAVGINLVPDFPEFGGWLSGLQQGTADLTIDNRKQMSNTPWTYYQYIYRLPLKETMTDENFGRYENEEAWALVEQLDQTPVDDTEGLKAVMSELQRIHLNDMPIIPLWYNGMWAQASENTWTGFPSQENGFLPTTWNGFWQMGGMRWLDNLELVATE